MSKLSDKTQKLVDTWLEWDKNPKTRKEIEDLAEQANEQELNKRLGQFITFGTAGLRGAMIAGYAYMNDLTVTQASQGLCKYLQSIEPEIAAKGIVVGYDQRHNSKTFAEITAATFLSQGIRVYLFTRFAATPLVPYAILLKKAAAGIMVTASHNPKNDNGYKVYWGNGSQIIEPHDKGITEAIQKNLAPWDIDRNSLVDFKTNTLLYDPTEDVTKSYFEDISRLYCHRKEQNALSKVDIVFTAMHGVGHHWVTQAFSSFNLKPYIPVVEQIQPDPEFPTVDFPNPEEGAGALKLAIETAERNNSRVIIANDPDADRTALAEKQKDGSWKIFSGNEIGIIFAGWIWRNFVEQNNKKDAGNKVDPKQCFMLTTAVSSQMLAAMAKKEGFLFDETLTGFKWLGNRVDQLKNQGYHFLFAYEEAIGFMIGDVCLDKDGVRAAAVCGELISYLYEEKGIGLNDFLDELYDLYGFFKTKNKYFFCYKLEDMDKVFEDLRNGGEYMKSAGKFKVKYVRDLEKGLDTSKEDRKAVLPKSSRMITFVFENGAVATIRGSGTEPKLKYYIELNGSRKEEVVAELDELVNAIISDWLVPTKYNLEWPKD